MLQIIDEELLKYIKGSSAQLNTMAEIHKMLLENSVKCTIEDVRHKVGLLHHDGYLGNEPTEDGVNMYYILFYPEYAG